MPRSSIKYYLHFMIEGYLKDYSLWKTCTLSETNQFVGCFKESVNWNLAPSSAHPWILIKCKQPLLRFLFCCCQTAQHTKIVERRNKRKDKIVLLFSTAGNSAAEV